MTFTRRLAAVTGSKLPYPALLLGMGVALVAESMIVTLGALTHQVPWLVASGLTLMLAGLLLAQRWWGPPAYELERITGESALPARWIVVTASLGRGMESAVTAVRYHQKHPRSVLERVVVLHTQDTGGRDARDKLCRGLYYEFGFANGQLWRC